MVGLLYSLTFCHLSRLGPRYPRMPGTSALPDIIWFHFKHRGKVGKVRAKCLGQRTTIFIQFSIFLHIPPAKLHKIAQDQLQQTCKNWNPGILDPEEHFIKMFKLRNIQVDFPHIVLKMH